MTFFNGVLKSPRSRRLFVMAGAAVIVAALAGAIASVVPYSSSALRRRVVRSLTVGFDANVEIADLHLHLFPTIRVEGINLTVRHRHRVDVPPLITIRHFQVQGSLRGLLKKHVTRLTIDGLDIEIPPKTLRTIDRDPPETPARQGSPGYVFPAMTIDELTSTDARLAIIPEQPDQLAKVWAIHSLHMRSVGFHTGSPFEAKFANAVPPGEITTTGTFGPWQRDDPGQTPLSGSFAFDHANLGVFKGISGFLSAQGTFGGSLSRIETLGDADTPDFSVSISGHPVQLHTRFHAVIDGTNGRTELRRIDASFLHSALTAVGRVVDTPGRRGRTVALDITMNQARLEDVLRLVVDARTPPVVGSLALTTRLILPPGEEAVFERMSVHGRFTIKRARFADQTTQARIDELSRRGAGQPAVTGNQTPVLSNFDGRLVMSHGTIRFPELRFTVPSAGVDLTGRFGLREQTLDFIGVLRLDAKVSQTTTGIRHWLLMLADPLFARKGGGSSIPIKITGTSRQPSFGLDRSRLFGRSRESFAAPP